MKPTHATIRIQNLRLRTYIGFKQEEMDKQQDVIINITIDYEVPEGALDDRVEDALDYKQVTKQVIKHVEQGRFLLLERLVSDILAISCEHPSVTEANVTVDKPHALRFADSVSLSLAYKAERANVVQLLEKAS